MRGVRPNSRRSFNASSVSMLAALYGFRLGAPSLHSSRLWDIKAGITASWRERFSLVWLSVSFSMAYSTGASIAFTANWRAPSYVLKPPMKPET